MTPQGSHGPALDLAVAALMEIAQDPCADLGSRKRAREALDRMVLSPAGRRQMAQARVSALSAPRL